ncbi:hypothetical protein J2Z20_002819 [Paenibacillus sediminis]|uniref:Uncharacterized protein n=1 Tax=Paenibacillus sediminis TaxID=664909 RepID=A0ABS4H6B5_9BACL|nr:hypothetical protein [Paenibacillus sediminis]
MSRRVPVHQIRSELTGDGQKAKELQRTITITEA